MIAEKPPVDLDGPDTALLAELLALWKAKLPRNIKRSTYYDGEAALKDFGISLPPQMRGIGATLGWTAKGVHAVTDRSQFEDFVSTSGSDDPFGLQQILWENRFRVEFPAAQISSAVHGCSFLTVTHGDVQSGEPDVLVTPRSAETSAALWDNAKRSLKGMLAVIDTDDQGVPTNMALLSPTANYSIVKVGREWVQTKAEHGFRRVMASPLVHKYELRRPLGHSRITRAAMYYSDAALRTIVRAEVSAEFYSAPEYFLFGAGVEDFMGDDKWSAIMGRIKSLDIDDGDDKPELHRFTGASPQPHTDQLKMWANLFADDQDLDVKFADSVNPSSADAIFAAKETLITTTRDCNTMWGYGAVDAMQLAVRLRDGLSEVPAEMQSLTAQFTDPAIVSPSARAAAFGQLATNIPNFGESEVGMEFAGLTREQIIRLKAEKRRGSSSELAERLLGATQATETPPSGDGELNQALVLKAKADALGVLRRAGVDANDAANRVGLDGVKFIPGNPITIKSEE